MEVQPEDVAALPGAQLVDVREDYEWETGHIPGARHVELAAVAASAPTIERDTPVVFVCRVGGRSLMAAHAFRRAGYDAYSLAGGVLAWAGSGLPFEGEVADH